LRGFVQIRRWSADDPNDHSDDDDDEQEVEFASEGVCGEDTDHPQEKGEGCDDERHDGVRGAIDGAGPWVRGDTVGVRGLVVGAVPRLRPRFERGLEWGVVVGVLRSRESRWARPLDGVHEQ